MKNIVLAILLLLSVQSFSQNAAPRFRVRVGGSYDWGVGAFRNTQSGDDYFTAKLKNGIGVHVATAVRAYKGIVLGIGVGGSFFHQNLDAATAQLKLIYQNPDYYTTIYPGYHFNISYGGLLAGYEFSFKKFTYMPMAFMGVAGIDNFNGYRVYQKKKGEHYFEDHQVSFNQDPQAVNWIYGIGAMVGYQVHGKLYVTGGLNYYSGKLKAIMKDNISTFSGTTVVTELGFSQPVQFVELELGIEMRLWRY